MRLLLALLPAVLAAQPDLSDNSKKPLNIRPAAVALRQITFDSLEGKPTHGIWVLPPGTGKVAGALFVHWYEPESMNSNRSQYLEEAMDLAAKGVASLLIETPWSDPDWFRKSRKRETDYEMSVGIVKNLRRALDVLLSEPRIDRTRVAYIGHDFGAMYGATLASVETRVQAWAFQAGTARFTDWFLYGPPMDPEPKQKFIEQLSPLDPITNISKVKGALLLQFAEKDFHVPKAKADALAAAAPEGKEVRFYPRADHALGSEASVHRRKWLAGVLRLSN